MPVFSTQTLHGTASPDCRETARGGAMGGQWGGIYMAYMECLGMGLPVRTAEKRPGVVPGGLSGAAVLWQSHGVYGIGWFH